MSSGSNKETPFAIKGLRLRARNGEQVDLDSYMVELSIQEDIFGNAVHGTLALSDSFNLAREMPIEGTESLYINIQNLDYPDEDDFQIKKDFRVYNVTDKTVDYQKGVQLYILHFVSWEAFKSTLNPVFAPFEGTIEEIATTVFDEYLSIERYEGGPATELEVLNPPINEVKFISPGWQPFKILNWLASKSISSEGAACSYLFWETTRHHYFGSIENIIQEYAESQPAGRYLYRDRDRYKNNPTEVPPEFDEYFAMNNMKIVDVTDHLRLQSEGKLANMGLVIDINKKDYFQWPYDHGASFASYSHLAPEGAATTYGPPTPNLANPKNSYFFSSKNTRLYSEFENNINEVNHRIYGNRVANIHDIQNFRYDIEIPGRTDLQVGQVVYLEWPDTRLKSPAGKSDPGLDQRYTGHYLITALNHIFTPNQYVIQMECARDAFPSVLANDAGEEIYDVYGYYGDDDVTGEF